MTNTRHRTFALLTAALVGLASCGDANSNDDANDTGVVTEGEFLGHQPREIPADDRPTVDLEVEPDEHGGWNVRRPTRRRVPSAGRRRSRRHFPRDGRAADRQRSRAAAPPDTLVFGENIEAMSASKPSPDAATGESQLGVIADELYGLRPDAFTKARDEQVRQARTDGDKALARELGTLRRPTQSAWLVNMMWRDQPDAVDELLELAADFDAALAEKAGQKLQALTTKRRELETQLIRRAETLATDAGVAASTDTMQEVRETLDVALTNPDVAAQVRTGRLVKPANHAGFPPSASTGRAPAAASRPKARAAGKAVRDDGPSGPRTDEADAGEVEERRREDAAREIANAREALDVAEAELSERAQAADQATEEYTVLSENLAELRDRVRALDRQVTAARRAADKAGRRRDQAAKAHERARAAVARAEQKLKPVQKPGAPQASKLLEAD